MFDHMFCVFIQMQEEPDEDSQCLSDDTDTEISTQVCAPVVTILNTLNCEKQCYGVQSTQQ